MKKLALILTATFISSMTVFAETATQPIPEMESIVATAEITNPSPETELMALVSTSNETGQVNHDDTLEISGDSLSANTIDQTTIASSLSAVEQSGSPIIVKKGRYYADDQKLNRKELKKLLNSDPECALEYAKSEKNEIIGIVVMVAIDVALIVTTGYMMGILPAVLVTLPFSMAAQKNMNNAIAIYNSKRSSSPVNAS
jgi:uncharacterized membrane protein